MKDFGDTLITDLDIDVPNWIDQEIDVNDIRAIVQGGCASGAYMPAVTYHMALKTMTEHGDEVLESLESLDLSSEFLGLSWSGMACYLLSAAVELWACGIESELDSKEREGN